MEISGAALNRSSIASIHHRLLFGRSDGGASKSATTRVRVPARASCKGAVLFDEGHLQYYEEGSSKQDKKRAKLIKTLKKDLSELYSMGFGVPTDQSDKIQEAAKQLLEQLNQIKVEEMEIQKKRKEEEKEMKKRMNEEKKTACKMDCKEDSSSCSSESSESDCEEPKILQLSDLKTRTNAILTEPNRVSPVPLPLSLPQPLSLPVSASALAPAPAPVLIPTMPIGDVAPVKIEVCMGGKCKKAGSMDLLNEFQMKVGGEGGAVVVGCKCMGKCKEGPNVRVSSCGSRITGNVQGEESVGVLRDQLCIGVGLDDVGTIVAHFFGEEAENDAGSLVTM